MMPPMKRSSVLAFSALLAFAASSAAEVEQGLGFPTLQRNSDSASDRELKLGIEAVTGYRSEYIFRGIKLADNALDFQLQAEIALSNHWILNLGTWYAAGSDKFTETAEFVELRYENKEFATGITLTGRQPKHSLLASGADVSPFFTWHATKDINLTAGFAYDTGAKGWYEYLEAEWTRPVTDSSFFSILAGASTVQNYYNRNGGNDAYARLEYTYNINRTVSLTPFVGTSVSLASRPGTDYLFGGVWFAVNF
jgi:hypothetical protein